MNSYRERGEIIVNERQKIWDITTSVGGMSANIAQLDKKSIEDIRDWCNHLLKEKVA